MIEAASPYIVGVKSGDLEVISSGMMHVSEGYPLHLSIDNLTMSFEFVQESSTTGASAESKVEGTHLTWVLKNFDNALGQGILIPQKVGSAFKREFFVTYWVWTPNQIGPRLVSYVLYLGKDTNE